MVYRVLIRRGHFREGHVPADRLEDRVVAEAVLTPRGPHKSAVDPAFEDLALAVVGPGDGEGADEVGASAGFGVPLEHLAVDALHRHAEILVLAGPAGGVDAGAAVQRIDAEAAVVGQSGEAG